MGVDAPARIAVGDVVLDPGTRTVRRGGKPVELTSVEFAILQVLLKAAGQVVSRDELARQAMGKKDATYDRSVDVHISSVRRKLGPAPDRGERIKTVRNAGYLYSLSSQGPGDRGGGR
jgi:two-component system response regulator CpxR